MDATIRVKVHLRTLVPEAGRVEWLERFGVPPEEVEVSVTTSLSAWKNAGAVIRANGSVEPGYSLRDDINDAIRQVFVEAGRVPEALPAVVVDAVIREAATRLAAHEADAKTQDAECRAREAAQDAERVRIRALPAEALIEQRGDGKWYLAAGSRLSYTTATQDTAAQRLCGERNAAPMREWIAQSGSERLRLALELGLSDAIEKSYREERLQLEREGWRYEDPRDGHDLEEEIREPSIGALRALADARKVDPEVGLVFLRTEHDADCQGDDACSCDARQGPALAAEFLGKPIYKDL